MHKRHEFSKKTKVLAFQRCKGRCEECGKKLHTGDIEYDHIVPAAFGGGADLGNCRVLCRADHAAKTAEQDFPRIAKANRTAAKHIGAHQSRHQMPCGRNSRLKKRLDGTVVDRETGRPV